MREGALGKTVFDYRISICGLTELPLFQDGGVSHVISILDPQTPEPEVFAAFPTHYRETYRFDDAIAPAAGLTLPEVTHIEAILRFGDALAGDVVEHLLVHCHAGVSRSTATVAILQAQANPGREEEIFAAIREVRPRSWPNSRMIAIADELLGLEGALSQAMRGHHRLIASEHPDLAELIRLHGRAHEIPED